MTPEPASAVGQEAEEWEPPAVELPMQSLLSTEALALAVVLAVGLATLRVLSLC